MAKIVEHIDGRPVVTEVSDSLREVYKQCVKSGMVPRTVKRMSTGCLMAEFRTSKGMRTLYIWP